MLLPLNSSSSVTNVKLPAVLFCAAVAPASCYEAEWLVCASEGAEEHDAKTAVKIMEAANMHLEHLFIGFSFFANITFICFTCF